MKMRSLGLFPIAQIRRSSLAASFCALPFFFCHPAFAGDRWVFCSASSPDGNATYYSEVFLVDIGDVYGQGDPERYGLLVNAYVDSVRANYFSDAGKGKPAVCFQSGTAKSNTQEFVANVKALSKEANTRAGARNVETHWSR